MEDCKLGRAAGVVIAYVFWNHRVTALVDFSSPLCLPDPSCCLQSGVLFVTNFRT